MSRTTAEQELRATWMAICELATLVGDALALLEEGPRVEGQGVRIVRGLHAAAVAGRRDDDWWAKAFPAPKPLEGWPAPPIFNAHAPEQPAEADEASSGRLAGSEKGWMWDRLTGHS